MSTAEKRSMVELETYDPNSVLEQKGVIDLDVTTNEVDMGSIL